MAKAAGFGGIMRGFMGGGQRDTGAGDGGEGGEGDDQLGAFDDEQDVGEGEESVEDVFADLFNPAEEEEEEDEELDADGNRKKPKGAGGQQQQQQVDDKNSPEAQLAQEIQTMISKMTVGEDAIPENFDPSDPKQFRDVLSKVQQQTAITTMQLAFKPMQAAMQQLSKDINAKIDSSLGEFGGKQQARQALESVVPEANDPKLKGLVASLFTQAQTKAKTPMEAARLVRRGLDAMGIKGQNNSADDPLAGGFKTGSAALDAFAPLPKQRTQRRG